MPSQVGISLGRGNKNNLSHQEIMNKRHQKKKKKQRKSNEERRKDLLEEYKKLNDVSFTSKKTTASKIMELVEDIKEEGMNDKRYLDIMNELMALNKEETEKEKETDYRDYIRDIRDNYYNTYMIQNIYDEIYRSYQPPSHFAEAAAPIISHSGMNATNPPYSFQELYVRFSDWADQSD